ncbi:MAG: helix-turn-helix domain-containing protein [Dysgonamonadaceae bacterium]|jgi:AraC-like DNA-binding protein|nr:helix-turn-helix domain-containing protein [Dysgonamonadaceae bacterium]
MQRHCEGEAEAIQRIFIRLCIIKEFHVPLRDDFEENIVMTRNKNGMEFWIFSLDDPALYSFYKEQANNRLLHYVLVIRELKREFPPETVEVMHLYPNTVLLIESYLLPVFLRAKLQGLCIVFAESIVDTERSMALLQLAYFHDRAEGIIGMPALNEQQHQCLHLLEIEYASPYDEEQPSVLRNLMINLQLLSSYEDYEGHLKAGHLLTYALKFIVLLEKHVCKEKKAAFYAERLGITTRILNQALLEVYKKTFREILSDYLLIEALRLLVFTSKTITQIAHELDFDVSYFIRFFSEKKGLHPKVLREKYRQIIEDL